MHVVVVGASGGTGRLVVDEALRAGHRATAVARNPARIKAPEGVAVITADVVHDSEIPLPSDTDVVISALGKNDARDAESTCLLGVVHLLASMRAHGIRRILAISAQPVVKADDELSFFTRRIVMPLVRRWGREVYKDLARMEAYLASQSEHCDWTVVRPGYLTDAEAVGTFRLARDKNVAGVTKRIDLAAALVQLADDEDSHGHAYGFASK